MDVDRDRTDVHLVDVVLKFVKPVTSETLFAGQRHRISGADRDDFIGIPGVGAKNRFGLFLNLDYRPA